MCADAERMSMPIVLVLAVTVGNGSVRTALMTLAYHDDDSYDHLV